MDQRFELLRQVPANGLKAIGAGRLKGKSDINPQWKIEAMTEVYGICGEGWYHELADEKTVPLPDGQIMLFMQVKVYIRDRQGEWSKPVVGFGGDYIVKKENSGLHTNDEAYKMCYTDALGNALKSLGVANDVYRGLWDGSKYNRREQTPLVDNAPKPLVKRGEGGETLVLSKKDGNYYSLASLPLQALNNILNDNAYAPIRNEVMAAMAAKEAGRE